MAGLLTNANYINNTIKPAIKSAIEAQGVTVPSTDSFLDYADRIAEIEGGGSGYQLKDLPTGSISTVTDAAELPLNALKVSVEAVQSGSGTPSPDNVRPIHGWSSASLYDRGVNLWDEETEVGNIDTTTGENSYSSNRLRSSNYIAVKGGAAITIVCPTNGRYFEYDANYNYIGNTQFSPTGGYITITPSSNTAYIRFILSTNYGTTYNDDVSINYPSSDTNYHAYQGKQYTQQFPTSIYGAEWDVVGGGMDNNSYVFALSDYNFAYNATIKTFYIGIISPLPEAKKVSGSTIANALCECLECVSNDTLKNDLTIDACFSIHYEAANSWINIRDLRFTDPADFRSAMTGLKLKYELATPTTIDLSPLSIRLLEGTNNIYADCGDVLEGEYFIDEGAIDVRKVDYSIGSNTALKISDGRILKGFASMSGYHARPLDASGNWLDVDWSKDFEIGVAFKFTAFPTYQSIFGDGNANSYRKAPRIYYDNSESKLALCVSSDGSTLAIDTYLNHTFVADKWYFIKAKFVLSTMTFTVDISDDFSSFTSLYSGVMASAPYHDTASLSLGGEAQQSNMASNTFLIDTFNTYIKGDGVSWGTFTGAFPS